MVWDGFYSLGGVEFANEERFRTYLESVGAQLPLWVRELDGYENTHAALGQSPYTTPLADRAPWVDVNDPVTHDLVGMTVLGVQGIEGSTRTAGVEEAVGFGGSVGAFRAGTREMRFTALIAGMSAEAAHAGMVWLSRLLWSRDTEQPLVPQLPGSSDLRFFLQNPDIPDGMAVNYIQNPDASGIVESLIGVAGQAYAFRVPTTGDDWAYRISSRTAAASEAILLPSQRPGVTAGEKWVARAQIWRDAATLGPRQLRLLLRYRDQYGNIVPGVGADATTVPTGVLYRWRGARFDSESQMLTPDGMIENFMINPSAEGKAIGLRPFGVNVARAVIVASSALEGKRAYRMTANTIGDASVASSAAPPAEAGQQWWGRTRARIGTASGERKLRADLVFLNAGGGEISRVAGAPVTLTPSGLFHRWRGTPGRSSSEEIAGAVRRINYSTNPELAVDAGALSGRNAKIQRVKTTVFGTAYAVRVVPLDTSLSVTGLNIGVSTMPVGAVLTVTFRILAEKGAIAMRIRGVGFESADGNPDSLVFQATTAVTTVTRTIRVTSVEDQVIRLARESNTNTNPFRVSRIGILSGGATYFTGSTANTGQQFATQAVDLSVGGVAPDGAQRSRLVLTRIGSSITDRTDEVLFDEVMLTQVDAPSDDTPPTLPTYFDGDDVSTYFAIATAVADSAPAAGSPDATKYDLVVTGEAPEGATSVELAIGRSELVSPGAKDVLYATNLMLSRYDENAGVPEYTPETLHGFVAEKQRWLQDVYAVAGPTILKEVELEGCGGVLKQVEFTIVAENPSWLQEGDDIPVPLPGSSSYAKYDDSARGVVRNFMPQFSPSSPLIPRNWVTEASAGSVEATSIRSGGDGQYVLQVRSGPAGTVFTTTISAISVLGARGGYENAVISVFLGANGAGKTFTVRATTYNGQQSVTGKSVTFTTPDASSAIVNAAHRVDIPLGDGGGAADGFRLTITGPTGTGLYYIGQPQVTLGATAFPPIYGGYPDDGTYTFEFDPAGFSSRKPIEQQQTHTVFPMLSAPPIAPATVDGYHEVGLTSYRSFIDIGSESIPANAVAVPVLRLDFERLMTRQTRIRFYPNPLNLAPELIDPSTFEHEWVVSPFSANRPDYAAVGGFMSLVIDGSSESVWLRAFDGTVIPGDQYVVTSEGAPISWPEFTGEPWVMSIDYPVFRQFGDQPATETWWRPTLALIVEE